MSTYHIEISIKEQQLRLYARNRLVETYAVSTAANGPGELMDSFCTPRGRHAIAEKIGEGVDPNTVFVARQPTGEIYTPALRDQFPDRDWILTRILWLRGLEPGVNQGGKVDTYQRYIYLHGSPDDVAMGTPGSIGCVRMRNSDIISLFEQVEVGDQVTIWE